MSKLSYCSVFLLLFAGETLAQPTDVTKWDPNFIVKESVVTGGIKWIDGKYLPIEGRAFNDVADYYDRLPTNVTEAVNPGVRSMLHHTAGMQFRFVTDSKTLHIRWEPYWPSVLMPHMTPAGHSGIDVYAYEPEKKRWKYLRTGFPQRVGNDLTKKGETTIGWDSGREWLINLPAYNGIKSFTLGIETNATIFAPPVRRSGITKPVVFYGTSITHGGCASRPGMSFPCIVGRHLDVPIVNLGFSGSGRMELEMADHLARIDASCYVLDCLANMHCCRLKSGDPCEKDLVAAGVTAAPSHENRMKYMTVRFEPFVRALRAKRPDVPIVLAEQGDVYENEKGSRDKNIFIRGVYEKLVKEGWRNLIYLPNTSMFTGDCEGTVDACHPNDWGMMSMAKAFETAIKKALGL